MASLCRFDMPFAEELVLSTCRWLSSNDGFDAESLFDAECGTLWLNIMVKNGLAPMCYHQLRSIPVHLPESIRSKLQYYFLMASVRAELLAKDRERIIEIAHRCATPLILLKGSALSTMVYPSSSLRPMLDLDVMIPAENESVFVESFCQSGGYFHKSSYRAGHHHLPIAHLQHSTIPIEIHSNIAHPSFGFKVASAELWQRSIPHPYLPDVAVLGHEDMLLHLCIHIARADRYQIQLRAYYDVYLFLQQYVEQMNWDVLCQRARLWGCSNAVFFVIAVCHRLFPSNIDCTSRLKLLRPKETVVDITQITDDIIAYAIAGNAPSQGMAALTGKAYSWPLLMRKLFRCLLPDQELLAERVGYHAEKDFWLQYYIRYLKGLWSRNHQLIYGFWKNDAAMMKKLHGSQRLRYLSELDKEEAASR